ncbi:formate dehydrogenase accessory sulfurtransferase FdhD (plasmid) [Sphingomonas paeninsulae]|uniref:Sulfur carrier protein FdhD n=1 Tax=Sphingomonas paeninsulae TaxID=2319844 RepID=A0A494T7T2_SPHPE|nr:formate dehydrogenase accessory sulfurtransferase FdhD [Sphingomonas paeninsulae]AYJ84960.1 formate dehydrogenase accessory sulfurtransferase FdhD [Sphingomonas paeninsulae]
MLISANPEIQNANQGHKLLEACALSFAGYADVCADRAVPLETPVSLEFDGIGYAVMMATPTDLEDFAIGFFMTEGLIDGPASIRAVNIHPIEGGWIVRLFSTGCAMERVLARARTRIAESSCGLCGIENIEQALRPLPPATSGPTVARSAIAKALEKLSDFQPLSRMTGAAHAAAFATPDGDIRLVREDVGRHNALDKLIGAMRQADIDAGQGFILLSARCSYELVEKAVRAGCSMLVTISAPTSLAVERAASCGLTLGVLARRDSMLVVNDPKGRFL